MNYLHAILKAFAIIPSVEKKLMLVLPKDNSLVITPLK
jgi:hypothetical protein